MENQRGPQFRKVRERLYGVVLGAEGYNKYKVRFDNGEEKVCSSQTLKIEKQPSNVPLAEFMPAIANGEDHFAIEADDAEEDDDILLTSTSAQENCDTTDTLIFANNVGTAADANNTTNTAVEDGMSTTNEADGVEDETEGGLGLNDSADIEEDDINDELAETVPYADRLKNAEEHIASLEGTQVEMEKRSTREKMTWTVVEEVFDADVEYGVDRADIGAHME